jgi:alkanesulfonate monooxygenase SsuD/methylene tetrahydromethanopterin reductase-like flavin-dependent oxidoreductase (luciferase family)
MQLAVQTRGDWNLILEAAKWAEERWLAAIALPDHYLARGDATAEPGFDHLTHLAGLARETSTIELVSLLAPVTFRHPAVHYKMAVTIDEMSGGRFTLGLGTGWLDEEFELFGIDYPPRSTRFELLEESLGYLQAAIAPEARSFEGRHYQLAEFDPHPHPKNLRLLVGGGGKTRTPVLAGRYADEFNIYACPPAEYRRRLELASTTATETGRSADAILFSSACPVVAAKDESEYRTLLDMLAQRTQSTPARIEEVYEKRFYPHGSGSKAAEMLAALVEAGCERFYAQLFFGGIEQFETVLTALEA